MTKTQLTTELAVSEKIHLSTAYKAVDGILRIIGMALAAGEDVTIRGFGILTVVNREERMARNPRTGDEVAVPAHRTVKFRPSKELKETLNK